MREELLNGVVIYTSDHGGAKKYLERGVHGAIRKLADKSGQSWGHCLRSGYQHKFTVCVCMILYFYASPTSRAICMANQLGTQKPNGITIASWPLSG
jgi:hypothetical protein